MALGGGVIGSKRGLAMIVSLGLLVLAPPGWAVTDGSDRASAPTWGVPAIPQPMTIPQEGVVVIQANFEQGWGDFEVEEPVFAVTLIDSEGDDVAGEAVFVDAVESHPSALIWRAESGSLIPGASYTLRLDLTPHSASNQPNYTDDISLVVSESETPDVVASSVVTHRPMISGATLRDHTCFAPRARFEWAPSEELPEWMHRTLSYDLGRLMSTGELLNPITHNQFKIFKTYDPYITFASELADTYCVSLTTRSLIDDSSVTEEHCLTEQDFLDALEDGQALCTLENLSEHLESEEEIDSPEPDEETGESAPTEDDGGCQGAHHGTSPWLMGLLALFALWLRANRRPVVVGPTRR